MKKASFLALLVGIMVLALGGTAFAIGPAYVDWTTGGANAGALPTPHKDYQLTTEKCAVCHSVHAAAPSIEGSAAVNNALWSGSAANNGYQNTPGAEQSQVLLRGSVSNACTYCHIDTSIGGKQIYGGVKTNYTTANSMGHNGSPGGSASCAGCHAVHGANTIGGAVASKILLNEAANGGTRPYQPEFVTEKYAGVSSALNTDSADRNKQITGFCTKCHAVYAGSSEQTITSTGYFDMKSYGLSIPRGSKMDYHNHPLKAAETTFSAAGAAFKGQAAFVDSSYCRSCHAAGTDGSTANSGLISSSFPHMTPGNASFLTAAENSNAAETGVEDGKQDGVCLRCHSNGTAGVGSSF